MSAVLTVPLALATGSTDHIAGVALGAALVVLLALLVRAALRWNDADELPDELARERPLRSVDDWRAQAQLDLARSRERRGNFER